MGLRKKTTLLLWVLLLCSLVFGIYKNFTAIDRHTIHEERIIKNKVIDTNMISSYVEDFVEVFYSWQPKKETLEKRTSELKQFLPENLQQLNQDMIRTDIPTRSIAKNIKIRKVDQLNQNDYSVVYSLTQAIEESIGDKTERKDVPSSFSVRVRTDGDNRITILSNPVMASLPQSLTIKSEPLQDDMTISQVSKDDILAFLNTFFKVYPTAKKTELLYYVSDKNIKEINKDYIFSEVKQINYFERKDGSRVNVDAVYLDKETKAILNFTYDLLLRKAEGKWTIYSGL